MRTRALLLSLFSFALPLCSFGQADWKDLKTDHFMVFYKPGYESAARDALKNLEYYRPMVQGITGNDSPPLTAIVIQDAGNYSNGLTDPLDQDIQLFTEIPSSLDLPTENWWAVLCSHEYTHLCHLSRLQGVPAFARDVFGNIINPNLELPAWIDEGFAVYNESEISPYTGRLNDGAFEAYLRVSALEGKFPTLMKATFSPIEYPFGVYYPVGAGFHQYLAQTYGEGKFSKFYGDYGTNVLSYFSGLFPFMGLDAAAEGSYDGKAIPEIWDDWKKKEESQDYDFRSGGERLTRLGWDLEGVCVSGGKLYDQRSYLVKTGVYAFFDFNEIVERDLASGKERVLVSTPTNFSAPLRVAGGKLYYAETDVKQGYPTTLNFGYLSELHELDLTTGRDHVVLTTQLRGFGLLPNGKLLIIRDRKEGFGSELFDLDPVSGQKGRVRSLDLVVDQVVADAGRMIVTAKKEWGSYNLYELDPKKDGLKPILPSPFIERNPLLSRGRLLFTANFGKKYALYEYDLRNKRLFRLTEQGYADWPALDEKRGQLYFAGLNSGGFDLYRMALEPKPYVPPKSLASQSPDYHLEDKDIKRGDYMDDLGWIAPKIIHAPVFQFDQYDSLVGLTLAGSDALYQFDYAALPIYDFKDNRPEIDLGVTSQFFAPWIIATEYTGIHDNSLYVQTAYPFVLKLTPGLSDLALGLNWALTDGLTNTQLDPFALFAFTYATTRMTLLATTPLQRVSWGSDRDRTGLFGFASITQYLPSSQLTVGVIGMNDPQNGNGVFPTLRGYDVALGGTSGTAFSEDFSVPFLKLRDGLWNPSLYFQDLDLDLFSDQAFDNNGASQWSYGAELHLETEVFNSGTGVPSDMGMRVAWNQEGQQTIEAFFSFYLAGLPSLDRAPIGANAWLAPKGMPNMGQMENLVEHPNKPLF